MNEVLVEKYKTQKRLAERSENMHDYFEKAKAASRELSKKYSFDLNYQKFPNKVLHSDNSDSLHCRR